MPGRVNSSRIDTSGAERGVGYLLVEIHFAAMANQVDDDLCLCVAQRVENPIVAGAQFVQTNNLTSKWFGRERCEVLAQPTNSLEDSLCNRALQFFQLPSCCRGKAHRGHALPLKTEARGNLVG